MPFERDKQAIWRRHVTDTLADKGDTEEGTWTPLLSSSGATVPTASTAVGSYTKIGNVVTFTCKWASGGAITGTLTNAISITGLPFTADSVGGGGGITGGNYIDWGASDKQLAPYVTGTTAILSFTWIQDDASANIVLASDFDHASLYLQVTGSYTV